MGVILDKDEQDSEKEYSRKSIQVPQVESENKRKRSRHAPKMAYEQEVAYVQQAQKKEAFDSEKYIGKKSLFGLIVSGIHADAGKYEHAD